MQEDQLYAMEDYISQYQQLVCRYRSENASLRRRLTQERGSTPVERELQPTPRTPANRPATKNGPTIEIPATPGAERKRAPTPDLEMPEVPPLKQSTSDEPDGVYQALADNPNWQSEQDRDAVATSYDESGGGEAAAGEAASAAGESAVEQTPPTAATSNVSTESAPDILLTGEIVENDDGGGPRLVIDIEPFDRSGHIGRFDGNVSLMLLATDAEGRQHSLARWDFEPGDVRSAMDTAASEPTMRFHVELPAGTPVNDATELWARLVPTGGSGKLLSHAPVDLSRAGVFSSRTNKIWPSEESVVATNYIETSAKPNDIAAPLNEGSWATAQPGKPANLPPDSQREGDGWRASSEPAAVVAGTTKPAPPRKGRKVKAEPPAKHEAKAEAPAKHEAKAEAVQQPAWSPDRPGKASSSARPSWSATR